MYNLKVYTANIYVANYGDTVANHGSVFSRNNLHFRSCIFTNCMFLIARHYHWRKAVSNKREIALLKKIQLVSKRRDNFKCWVLLLLFSLVLSSSHIYIYIYIWNILNLQISFLSTLREFKMLYILWREISLSLARGCHILFSCQFFSSLFFVRHPIIFQAC